MTFFNHLSANRVLLLVIAFIGGLGLNGLFLYHALVNPYLMGEAQANPISLVFMLEAFLLVGFFAWMIHRFGLHKPGWLAFVIMSIAGSLAFSVPAFILWHMREGKGETSRLGE